MNRKYLVIILLIFVSAVIGCQTNADIISDKNSASPAPTPAKPDSSEIVGDSIPTSAISDIRLGENGELWVLPHAEEKIYYKDVTDKWTEFKSARIGYGGKFDFIDAQNGWLIDDSIRGGRLLRTTDAGQTWRSVGAINKNFESAYKIKFLDQRNGLILCPNGIWHTGDGGKKWSFHVFDKSNGDELFDQTGRMYFSDAKNGWVGGDKGNVYKTSDAGKTWKTIVTGEKYKISAIYFLNDKRGWFYEGSLFASTNGGESWQKIAQTSKDIRQKLNLDLEIEDIHFINEKEGWLIGTKRPTRKSYKLPITKKIFGGILLHTIDGGMTWEESNTETLEEPIAMPFTNILFEKNSGKLWLVGWNNVYRSADNGRTWEKTLAINNSPAPYE